MFKQGLRVAWDRGDNSVHDRGSTLGFRQGLIQKERVDPWIHSILNIILFQ